jgi:hypothetical protein
VGATRIVGVNLPHRAGRWHKDHHRVRDGGPVRHEPARAVVERIPKQRSIVIPVIGDGCFRRG